MPTLLPTALPSYAAAAQRGLRERLLTVQSQRAAHTHRVLSKLRNAAKRKASPARVQSVQTSGSDGAHEAAADPAAAEETSAKRAKKEAGTGDVAHQPERAESAEPQLQEQATSSASAQQQQLHSHDAALVEARTKEIRATAMSFAKNQPHLRFQATGSSFMHFRMQFEAFLEQLECAHVLSCKPGDTVPGVSAVLHAAQQSNVYYMLTIAAPREAQAGLRSACDRTAYDAWKLLRDRFLGEEAAYKQQLMLQFASLRWLPKEQFTAFDARFTSLIAELELITGEEKSPEDKQACILRAIQTREGPHSATDYLRMRNVSNALTFAAVGAGRSVPFETWLAHMRDEARAIEEQQRTQHDSHRHQHSNATLPAQLNAVTVGKQQQPCRLWQRSNGQSCRYGDLCRFTHGPVQQGVAPLQQQLPAGLPMSKLPCRDWRQGRCHRGDSCRYLHGNRDVAATERTEPQTHVHAHSVQQQPTPTDHTPPGDRGHVQLLVNAEGPLRGSDSSGGNPQHLCIIDSGAGGSMTPRRELFEQLHPLDTPVWLTGALSGQAVCATEGGPAVIPLGVFDLRLEHVVLCEQLQHTLLSMVQLRKLGYTITLGDDTGELVDPSGLHRVPLSYSGNVTSLVVEWSVDSQGSPQANATQLLPANAMTRRQQAQLEQILQPPSEHDATISSDEPAPAQPASPVPPQAVSVDAEPATTPPRAVSNSVELAHARYGHLGERKLQQVVQHAAVDSFLLSARDLSGVQALVSKCDPCQLAKQARQPFGDAIDHQVSAANDMATADL